MGCCNSGRDYCRVKVLRAENLPDVDIIGKIDPYVQIIINGKKQKTEKKLNDQNPTWNEEFIFEDVRRPGTTVNFRVKDWDKITSNDFVGGCELAGEQLPQSLGETKQVDFDLIKDNENRGRLFVEISFHHED